MCSYISSDITNKLSYFFNISAINISSFLEYTEPLGLQGELNIKSLVLFDIFFSISLTEDLKLFSIFDSTTIGFAPHNLTISKS